MEWLRKAAVALRYTVAPAAAVAMRGTPVAAEKEELEPVDRARMGPFDVDRLLRQPVPADDGKGNALYRKIVKSPCNIFLQRMLVAKIADAPTMSYMKESEFCAMTESLLRCVHEHRLLDEKASD